MKIISYNKKIGIAKLVPESLDDLYHLSKLAEPDDVAGAKSSRKIKLGSEQSRGSVRRETHFIKIKIKKIDLDYSSSILRLHGEVVEGPEEIPKGSAHALTISARDKIELTKENWKKHHISRMDKAKAKRFASAVLVCSLDDDIASFASISDAGIRELGEIELMLSKKTSIKGAETPKKQYETLISALENYFKQLSPSAIVLASPGFWKDELLKRIKNKNATLAKKIRIEKISAGGLAGIREIVKKGFSSKESYIEDESKLIDELQKRISKKGAVTYGLAEVSKSGAAIEKLAISDNFITAQRKIGKYSDIEKLIDVAELAGGLVFIVDSKSDSGKVLDGLGGVAALLRYKL